jgi:hypothetical protein
MKLRHATILALALILGACAHRDAIITRTTAGIDAAYRVFQSEDERVQTKIVDAAPDKDTMLTRLRAHRTARDQVNDAFVAAYGAVAAAAMSKTDLNMSRLAKLAFLAYEAYREWSTP